jgi:DNA-binding SARP family transcriptional activator
MAIAEAERHTSEHRVPAIVNAPAASERLRVRALGALQVAIGERIIDSRAWGSTRPRELLVYLLLHPEGRTKEQIGLAFWPDASPAQLRNSFHVTLHRLRRALGRADWVSIAGERYRIDPSLVEEFDVAAFERDVDEGLLAARNGEKDVIPRLEKALAHASGEFMDGEAAGDWHVEYRERLQRRQVDALMALGNGYASLARYDSAEEAYRRILMRDELDEVALRALMRTKIATGERPQAMREYTRFAERLKSEYGASPARETERLFAEAVRH